jgi:hypothetical protein
VNTLAIGERALRVHPGFRLTLADRLPAAERERIAPLLLDPDFYGLVRDAGGETRMAASREVALLLLTIEREPGPLPRYLRERDDVEVLAVVERLVLDGVLEIERDGEFVSGGRALAGGTPDAHSMLARLSRRAVVALAGRGYRDHGDASAYLYRYNRVPLSPAWSARIPSAAALRSFLGLSEGPTAALLNSRWSSSVIGLEEGWIHWSTLKGKAPRGRSGITYKVYVSPTLDALPRALAAAVPVLAEARVSTFKVGSSAHSIARADKFVAYFSESARARECGAMLRDALRGVPAQGVPFTAPIDDEALISFGADQPDPHLSGSQVSWRQWVCRRLARYVLAATSDGAEDAIVAADFALQRLRLDGVDTLQWTPPVELAS